MPFTPYATIKDAFASSCFLLFFAWFVFYVPNYLGHPDNYIPANPLVTPAHIVPEWYFLPFYAILRADPEQARRRARDVRLDRGAVRSCPGSTRPDALGEYRPLFKLFFWIFVVVCIGLGYLGSQPAEGVYVIVAAS